MSEEFKQEIFLSGGMNSVSDPRLLPDGDYLTGTRNVRIGVTSNNTLGSVQSFEGNVELDEVSSLLTASGTFKCVGQIADIRNKATVMFIWNSLSGIFYRNLPTAVTSNSLQVITEGWTVNIWQNHRVRIVSGTGANQVRDISSNNNTILNLTEAWNVLPDTSSQFVIERIGHQIIRYYYDLGLAERLCYEPCLNFNKHSKIHSVDIVNDLLYWVQDDEPQKKLNMNKGATLKDSYKFRIYIGPDNPGLSTSYTINIKGAFGGAHPTIGPIIINYPHNTGDTLREVLKAITDGLNANADFDANTFTATYLNDCVEVECLNFSPKVVGGNWDVVTSANFGDIWWVGINFYTYINEETLDVLKWPSWVEPQVNMAFDPNFLYNYLRGTRFQVAVRYIYDDGENSKYSPFSVMALDNEIVGSNLTDTNKNYIQIDYSDNGRMQSKRNILVGIEIAVRDANESTFKRIANLSASQLTGIFNFYNDSAYSTVPTFDILEGQDFIPRSSKSQDVLINRLNYSNNLEGFDNTPIDVKLSTEYTGGETGPATFDINGKINIRNYYTNALVSISGNVFGSFEIPQGGFTVFLAGTSFHAVTVQSGTDQNFSIKGVPNGRYFLRVASHLCKNGDVTWGDIYDTSNPANIRWQDTSTFVRSAFRYKEVFVNGADVTLGSAIEIDSLPVSSLTWVLGTPQLAHIYGYVYDGQNPYVGYPVAGDNIRNGLAMENAKIDWSYYKTYSAFTPASVIAVNPTLKQIEVNNPGLLNVGEVIFIKISGVIPDGIAVKIITKVGNILTLDIAVSAGYIGANIYLTQLYTQAVVADERGFFYAGIDDNPANTNVVRWESTKAWYNYADIKQIGETYYIGNLSPEKPILVASTGYNTMVPQSATAQADNMLFMPNYNNDITRDYRTTLSVSVKDNKNNPIENILVSFSASARQVITDSLGVAKIIVYGFYDTVSPVERPGKIILGNPSPFNIVTFTSDSHVIGIGDLTFPPYNTSNSFDYLFTGVESSRILSYLKHGAKYKYGIVYYDRGNRRGYVNNSQFSEVAIPFWTPNEAFRFLPLVSWEINHRPPVWATHYSWVRTRNLSYNNYLQIPIQAAEYVKEIKQDGTVTTTNYAAGDALYIDINIKTLDAYKNQYQKSILAYAFSEGDRLRLIKDEAGDYYDQYIDFEIVSYDTTTFKVRVKNIFTAPEVKMDATTKAGPVIELYSPIKLSQESLFFEVCETYEIGNPYTVTRFHAGPNANQTSDLSTPATGQFQSGDTYIVSRTINIYPAPTTPFPQTRYYESAYLSDFIADSDDINIGRPNIVNLQAKEQWLETGIRHSNPILKNTLTNGLSTWDSESQLMLNESYGPVCRIVGIGGVILKCYQTFKRTSIYIGRVIAQSADGGTGTMTTISGYYGTVNPSEEDYGCQHPESVVASGNSIWFFDVINSCIVRDSVNGMESISDKKMYSYFSDKAALAYTLGTRAKVYATFDTFYDELYFSFIDENNYPNLAFNDTIIYLEKDNEFKEQLDLYAIDGANRIYPDMLGSRGQVLVSWINGAMWRHNVDSAIPANFYGTQHKPQVKIACNLGTPEAVKAFTDVTINANKVWFAPNDTDITVPPTALYPTGMKSRLLINKFKLKEGVFYSEFMCDLFTPNVLNPILNGRKLRGQCIIIRLESKIEYPNTESVLMSIIVKGTPSPKTI